MLNRICLIVNYNLYESKRYFTSKLADALKRKGIETLVIDVNEASIASDTMNTIRHFNPDLTCSFNALLPISETKFLCDFLEVPHWSILVDPVLYSVHLTRSPYTILSCVDRSDLIQLHSYQFKNAFFCPHAVEPELNPGNEKRIYDVVFLGTCYDYESLRASWQQQYPAEINKALDDAIEIVFSDNSTSLVDALLNAWNASKLDPTAVDFAALFYYLDNYTRGKDRVALINSITEAPIHVFGELSTDMAVGVLSWKHYLGSQKNVLLHPSVPFAESLKILKQSKICLNSMPFFKNGTHERVFTGLACGAVPATTDNNYFREFFEEEKHVIYYSMNQRGLINEKVNALLHDESRRVDIAKRGRALVMENHTWNNRVDEMLEEMPDILNRLPT